MMFDAEKKNNANDHVREFIKYYISTENPGYAVLVTGDWGVGKTNLIRQILPWDTEEKDSYYVSLFAINTAKDLSSALFLEFNPRIAKIKEATEKISEALRGSSVSGFGLGNIMSALPILGDSLIKQEVDNSKPLIFDDLERCPMENSEIMGLINFYVEHKKCRVIVIANEEKIKNTFDSKEKIFGHTLRVEPDIENIVNEFLSISPNSLLIRSEKTNIMKYFKESECTSLRIFKRVIADLVRIEELIDKENIEKNTLIQEMIALYACLSIAARMNLLTSNDLINRSGKMMMYEIARHSRKQLDAEITETPFVKIQKKHSNTDLESQIINDQTLSEMIFNGRFDKNEINDGINQIIEQNSEDPRFVWQRVMKFSKLSKKEIIEAIEKMEIQYQFEEYPSLGDMFQIITLRFMLSSHGAISFSIYDVFENAKERIQKFLEKQEEPIFYDERINKIINERSYKGYVFWIEPIYEKQYCELVEYYFIKAKEVSLRKLPEIGNKLLQIFTTSVEKFIAEITQDIDTRGRYAKIPVLAEIDCKKFVDIWMMYNDVRGASSLIKNGLEKRYRSEPLEIGSALYGEASWVEAVIGEMKVRASEESGLVRYKLERSIPEILLPQV